MRIYISIIFTFITLINFGQDEKKLEHKLENCAWIAGNWRGEAFGGQVEENWSEPTGGSMMATFKLIQDGQVAFYEIEVIRESKNTLILQLKHFNNELKGWEKQYDTVDFPLKEITLDKVVFEGMTFERISDNEMNVLVDIKNDKGEVEVATFNYHRAKPIKKPIKVKKAIKVPEIDGKMSDKVWTQIDWLPIDQRWLGDPYEEDDFNGRYKLTWTEEALYLLVEIEDDKLFDKTKDPLKNWWDDDCVEIFIDENNNGGNHQFNHSAFAYHVGLDGSVVDMSESKEGILFNSHLISKRVTKGNTSIWEFKIFLFDEKYMELKENTPLRLYKNKRVGFALAYCDNDESENRENFIGSVLVDGDDKNRGWIDANIFGTLLLIEEN